MFAFDSRRPTEGTLTIVGRQCAQLLLKASEQATLDSRDQTQFENSLGRFKIWAGNIGLFAPGLAGIDHRFKQDEESREVLQSMLEKLKRRLENVVHPPVDTGVAFLPPENRDEAGQESSDKSSSPSSDESSIEEETISNLGGGDDDDSISPAVKDVNHVIDLLYRFLKLIKTSSSETEHSKVTDFKRKHPDLNDDVDFESFVRWSVQREMPNSSPALLERLISAALYRRWRMLYKRSHYQKLKQGVESWFVQRNVESVFAQSLEMRPKASLQTQRGPVPTISVEKEPAPGRRVHFAPMSATEASGVKKLNVPIPPKSAALSTITRSAIARRSQLDIPSAPSPDAEGMQEATCPYCCMVIGTETIGNGPLQRSRWVRHVVRDCSPYVCLFDSCEQSQQQYTSTYEWWEHMRRNHALLYCCQVPGHESFQFDSRSSFEQHLKTEHSHDFLGSEITEIVERAKIPRRDLFTSLSGSTEKDAEHNSILCIFCGEDVSPSEDAAAAIDQVGFNNRSLSLQSHVAGHLEALAILSLPADKANSDTYNQSNAVDVVESIEEDFKGLPAWQPLDLENRHHPTRLSDVMEMDEKEQQQRLQSAEIVVAAEEVDVYRFPELNGDRLIHWQDLVRTLQSTRNGGSNIGMDEKLAPFAKSLEGPRTARALWHIAVRKIRRRRYNLERRIHEILGNFNSQQGFEVARSWFQHCSANHLACRFPDPPELPSRVINVEAVPPFLHVSTGERGDYIVLSSYIESVQTDQKLTNASYDEFQRHIDTESLPPLWRDAITLTKSLGIKYLWVDALCIVQNDGNDWERAVAYFHRLYSEATLTIAGTTQGSEYESLFQERYESQRYHFTDNPSFGKDRWRSRAWMFPDEYLSRRLLTFEATEVAWHCKEEVRCECTTWSGLKDQPQDAPENLYEEWREQVAVPFSQRRITVEKDRLLPLAVVATWFSQRIQNVTGEKPKYMAGIWEGDLLHSLCWIAAPDNRYPQQRVRANTSIAPSWSWVSVGNGVLVRFMQSLSFNAVEVLNMRTTQYRATDDFESVEHGSIVLSAYLFAVNFRFNPSLSSEAYLVVSDWGSRHIQIVQYPEITERKWPTSSSPIDVNLSLDYTLENTDTNPLYFLPFDFGEHAPTHELRSPTVFHGLLLTGPAPYRRAGYVWEQRSALWLKSLRPLLKHEESAALEAISEPVVVQIE